ncbi:MAG: hypothetical protein FWD53_03670, partial [Phycisphaerales bacterium]|nr:hypothetical protein [Phycisphaerales bacterium]
MTRTQNKILTTMSIALVALQFGCSIAPSPNSPATWAKEKQSLAKKEIDKPVTDKGEALVHLAAK